MSVVSRKLRATPVRSSSETWKVIALLLAPDDSSDAHVELMSVSGTAASLISSDAMKDAAVVCIGSGPRVRIYCLCGEDAITGDDANAAISGWDVTITSTSNQGSMTWACASGGVISDMYLPSACR